jgi:RNA polymerase sigma-70 factor (ECF subfamily)
MNSDSRADLADPVFLRSLRSQMLKFAMLHLQDEGAAEDAVQEALAGALKNVRSFEQRSALKTWVFGILKNKITDTLRRRQREATISSLDAGDDADMDALFTTRGHWYKHERPVAWAHPLEDLRSAQFWLVFEACLHGLPDQQARVFTMREFLEMDSAEICDVLKMTTSNLHVVLYRARLRLRECLENTWFLEGEKPC